MAIEANSLTLAHYALFSEDRPDELTQGIVMDLISNGSIMARDIPFVPNEVLTASGLRFNGSLPAVNWQKANTEPTQPAPVVPEDFTESAYSIREKIEVDTLYLRDKTQLTDPQAFQVDTRLKAIALDFNNKFINNTPTAHADAPVGIRHRLDQAAKWGIRSGNKINAAVDLTNAALSKTELRKLVEKLNLLLWSVGSPSGDGVVLYMNFSLINRINGILAEFAGVGGFSVSQDQFGRTVTSFRGARIEDIGTGLDQETPIITSTETVAGVDGAGSYTSVYAVNYSPNYLAGWNWGLPNVTTPAQATRFKNVVELEYVCGLYTVSARSLGRLHGIKID